MSAVRSSRHRRRTNPVERMMSLARPGSSLPEAADSIVRLVRPRHIGMAVRDFSHACLIRLVDFPEMPLRTAAVETVKAGHTALIIRSEFPVNDHPVPAAYKRVRRSAWWKRIGDLFRRNACQRNFELGLELLRRGIATARPLAVIIPRRGSGSVDSFLATEWIEGGSNLYRFLGDLQAMPVEQRRLVLPSVCRAVGSLLGRMHGQGVAHRDLKPGNILVRSGRTISEAFVVDLDGVTLHRDVNPALRARNVSRLVVTLTSKCRLVSLSNLRRGLAAYLAGCGGAAADWKTVWRAIARETARRAKR